MQVLAPLGADITGSRYLDPDGSFPNHIPNPENAQAMAAASEAVRESQADLGIVFDTDVDRCVCVCARACVRVCACACVCVGVCACVFC